MQCSRSINGIDTSKYSPEGLRDAVAQFASTAPAKAFDATVTSVQDVRDQAAARIEHLKRELSPDQDMASEIRASRYWDSTVKLLDNIKDTDRVRQVAEDQSQPPRAGRAHQAIGPVHASTRGDDR